MAHRHKKNKKTDRESERAELKALRARLEQVQARVLLYHVESEVGRHRNGARMCVQHDRVLTHTQGGCPARGHQEVLGPAHFATNSGR
jgi:hypothetical protein